MNEQKTIRVPVIIAEGKGFTIEDVDVLEVAKTIRKVVLLNALVPPENEGLMYVSKIDSEIVKIIAECKEIESYIGHAATASLLSSLLGREVKVNRGMYAPKKGDLAIVVRLKQRMQSPGEASPTLDDLEFYQVYYL